MPSPSAAEESPARPAESRQSRHHAEEPVAAESEPVAQIEEVPADPVVDDVDDVDDDSVPAIVESVMRERQSRATLWMTAVTFVITALVGMLVVEHSGPVTVALFPTLTPIPPTPSFTPSATPIPTETPPPSDTPTITPTPLPTSTPQPPRFATVAPGETLIGLALRYNVSLESIAEVNQLNENLLVQSGQTLQIPWPSATPPLMPVEVNINGQTVIADPRGCERYTIQEGDSLFAVANQYGVPVAALLAANRRSEQDILRPGDSICIPQLIYDGVLPPTPGPSPTASPTSLPTGPVLLFPVDGAAFEEPTRPLVLQWVAVKDLTEEEWYMVEVTDLSDPAGHPYRGFTRQTSFRLPTEWRPTVAELYPFRWRISIVRATGQRQDGQFTFTYGGGMSPGRLFYWMGAVPTPTPTPTATPSE